MIDKLIELKKENPELPIKIMVDYEVFGGDYGYWEGKIFKIDIDFYCVLGDRIYLGEDEIREELEEMFIDDNTNMSDEDFAVLIDKKWNEKIDKNEVQKAIIVYINN